MNLSNVNYYTFAVKRLAYFYEVYITTIDPISVEACSQGLVFGTLFEFPTSTGTAVRR